MKRIIDRKIYNTETAEFIVSRNNGYYNSFKYEEENLYRTKKGVFFLHAEGGPLSSYAEPYGNGWTEGETIVPLDDDEAYRWLEGNNEIEIMEEYFKNKFEEA